MSQHDAHQQAIEGYLEALLTESDDSTSSASADPALDISDSRQAQHLRQSMSAQTAAISQQAKTAEPAVVHHAPVVEADPGPQVLMPELSVSEAEPEVQPDPVLPEAEMEAEVDIDEVSAPDITEPEPEPEPEPEQNEVVASRQEHTPAPPAPPEWKNGRPLWAQERFECLLFKVKGLTLAVPLVELGGIIRVEKEPTPLFGQPRWFSGMLRSNGMNVCMVDTAQWVLPPHLAQQKDPYQFVIRIHDSHWGLCCNQVAEAISLGPEQVRWRTQLGRRPWLAGTVIDHMCALIDVSAFARLLEEGHGDMAPANLSALENIED